MAAEQPLLQEEGLEAAEEASRGESGQPPLQRLIYEAPELAARFLAGPAAVKLGSFTVRVGPQRLCGPVTGLGTVPGLPALT